MTRVFGKFVAVDHVSFEVGQGEVFGFLGPNGAGKTTAIKMLAGLLLPSSGRATVAGHDVLTETEAIKKSIGYMSQLFSLYGDLTVEENIAFFAGIYGDRHVRGAARREWAVEMARLDDARRRLVRDLSLGWKQRLALGCAALHEPRVLFLDEPTSGVDPVSRRSFWDLIRAISAAGTTVLVTTHYLAEAEYCNRLALMNRGKLAALDTPAGLKASMKEPLLELRVADAPRAVKALRDVPEVGSAGLFGRAVHLTVPDPDSAGPAIAAALGRVGLSGELVPITPSLEDVFVHLVERSGGAAAS
ncbi:MAG: ATP-binding cassette domain-containing protein [Candidatus Eiseniibacteriota bacterium]